MQWFQGASNQLIKGTDSTAVPGGNVVKNCHRLRCNAADAAPAEAWWQSRPGTQQPSSQRHAALLPQPLNAPTNTEHIQREHGAASSAKPHVLLDVHPEEPAAWQAHHASPELEAEHTIRGSDASPAEQSSPTSHAPWHHRHSRYAQAAAEHSSPLRSSDRRQAADVLPHRASSAGSYHASAGCSEGIPGRSHTQQATETASPTASRPGSAMLSLQGTDASALLQRGIRMQWSKPQVTKAGCLDP